MKSTPFQQAETGADGRNYFSQRLRGVEGCRAQARIDLIRTLQSVGFVIDSLESDRLIRCKTADDKGTQKSGWYRLFDDADVSTCVYGDWRVDLRGVWVSRREYKTSAQRTNARRRIEQAKHERQVQQAAQWMRNRAYLVSLWEGARPLTESCAAGIYLERRGLAVNTDALRFVPKLDYWHDGDLVGAFPAMLGAVTGPDGALVSVHRTYLTVKGQKAPVPGSVKKLCSPAGPMAGSSIKIGEPAPRPDGRLGLGVAEGIETAIAATLLSGIPTWSCVSAHGLQSFEPPPDVHYLYIFGDNDESGVGQKAATDLGKRTARMGFCTRILIPEAVADWNDELVMRGATV